MPNPLAIGVTIGGLLLDVVAPRPKPRAGLRKASLLSARAVPRTPRHGNDVEEHDGPPVASGIAAEAQAGTAADGATRYRPRRVATFAVKFLGCKVSQADAMLARAALLAAGHAEAPESEAELHVDQHVLHHQRGRGQVAPVGPSLAERPPTRCTCRVRGEPRRRPVRRDRRPRQPVRGHRRRRRRRSAAAPTRRLRRPRARRARAPTPITPARAHPRVRQGPGRLRLSLRLLHHPHGPRRAPARVRPARSCTRCAAASPRASPRW